MLAFIYSFFLFFAAEASHAAEGGFLEFYNKYLNYPGFEAWKFINLAIFVFVLVYLLNKPLTEKFKAKREAIRADLIRAEEEKQAALAALTAAEAKLVALDAETRETIEKAKHEAEVERARIAADAEREAKRLREQAAGEAARLSQNVRTQLRRFAAEESIRRAEEKLRSKIDPQSDARLVKSGIEAIGGLN